MLRPGSQKARSLVGQGARVQVGEDLFVIGRLKGAAPRLTAEAAQLHITASRLVEDRSAQDLSPVGTDTRRPKLVLGLADRVDQVIPRRVWNRWPSASDRAKRS
jgi:hypothetical protein